MIDVTKATGRDAYRVQLEKEILELVDPETGIVSLKYADYITCPLCGCDNPKTLFVVKGYPHVRCLECRMVYVNPQVKPEKLQSFYAQQSLANDMWVDVLLSDAEKKTNFALYDKYIQLLEGMTDERFLVDLGCGIGDFMVQAQERGWIAEGVDLNKKAVNYAVNIRSLEVKMKRLEDAGYAHSSIPVLVLTGVLEHLNDPRAFMRMASNYLTPDGLVLFQVPNLHSIANMILQEKSTSFDGRNHLLCFSIETLNRLCKEEGFSVETYCTDIFPSHSLCKMLQYGDPYKDHLQFENLPPLLRPYFEDEKKSSKLAELVGKMEMGQRIMLIGRKNVNAKDT